MSEVEITAGRHLGAVCLRGHDWNGTGMSVRLPNGACVICSRIATHKCQRRKAAEVRELKAAYLRRPEVQARRLEERKAKQREYYHAHREERLAYVTNYDKTHKAARREYSKQHYQANKARIDKRSKAYRMANPGRAKAYYRDNKAAVNKQRRIQRGPVKSRLNITISNAIRQSLAGGKKGSRHWEDLVGYTLAELVAHLEALFVDGMSWENRGKWHIDHRIPVSAFNFDKPGDGQFKQCWALDNLQPLWGVDNMKKGDDLSWNILV